MITERAELQISPGKEEEFEKAMRETALPVLKSTDGVEKVRFGRCVEKPDRYMILVEWTSLEHHARFPEVARYGDFRASFAHSIDGAMEHFQLDDV